MVKEIKKEISDWVRDNKDGQVDPTIVWDTVKAIMRGRLISGTAYLKKTRAKFHELEKTLRNLEKQQQKDIDLTKQIK